MKIKVIILCTHNSARSQMAEAFLTRYAGDQFDVYSAGYEPQPINPLTIRVMQEIGYELSKQKPKELWPLAKNEHFGIIITVCNRSEEKDCPTMPGVGTRLFWDIEDPAAFKGTEEQQVAKFRQIRDQVNAHVKNFLAERKIPIKSE
jgi:arsenate reductase